MNKEIFLKVGSNIRVKCNTEKLIENEPVFVKDLYTYDDGEIVIEVGLEKDCELDEPYRHII